jgi:hypothetical protein
MRISERFQKIEDAVPKAARALQKLDGIAIFHESYGVRHPFAAYNVSLAHVARRLLTTLETLAKTQREMTFLDVKSSDWELPLLDATDHMLDALMEHMDDCGGIIRSFFPSPYEKKFKTIFSDFKRSVEPYRRHIGAVVNYIKHNQGRLRSVTFSWGGHSSLGYFVEGPTSEGGLGPVAAIHPTESTAFSFYRDIPFHICSIYAVGARLATALHAVDRRIIAADSHKGIETRDTNLVKVLRLAGALPHIYFDDEVLKDVPCIRVREEGVSIDFPAAKIRPLTPPAEAQISISFRGDGVTRTFKMPYFKSQS